MGGGERGRRTGRGTRGGEVGEVGPAVGAEQQVVASDKKEVVTSDEIGGDEGGQRGAVPVVARLHDEGEFGLIVQVGNGGVLVLPAPLAEVRLQVEVLAEEVAHLAAGLSRGR